MEPEASIALRDLSRSGPYRLELLRSERRRVGWFMIALGVMIAFTAARSIAFFRGQPVALAALGIALLALLLEAAQLALVSRALRGGGGLSRWFWAATSFGEAVMPTAMLFVTIDSPAVGPQRALVYPVVCLYFVVLMLSTLRLQPALCVRLAAICAAGYLAAVVYALHLSTADVPPGERIHPSIYATFALMIVVAGAAAAGVAGQLRNRLVVALGEAEARRRSELHARDTLIFALAKLAEYRDTDTGAHLERIAGYAGLLARALPRREAAPEESWIDQLRVASSLHDLGKVGLPDAVLCKPGPLTAQERAVMQRHPSLGAEALRAIRTRHGDDALLRLGEQIAVAHHERWDGTGYPGGLAGAAIPLAARIVAVADVYDALTTTRVYKPPLGHGEACDVIRAGAGTHFDPDVVEAFFDQAARFDALRAEHSAAHVVSQPVGGSSQPHDPPTRPPGIG